MKNNFYRSMLVAMAIQLIPTVVLADSFHLFNPVPKEKMHDFATDRPDRTESPITVDAGHFQIETDFIVINQNQTTVSGQEIKTSGFGVMVSNLKAGLTDNIDFQVVLTPYVTGKASVNGVDTQDLSGFGDTTLRLKWNLIGNNEGDFSFGLMPFMTLPTSSGGMGHKKIEAGLIAPFGLSLPNEWEMGGMFQYNRAKNDADDVFHHEYVTSLTMGHSVYGDFDGYVEFWNQISSELDSKWEATLDFGLLYHVAKDVQLDAGVNIGITEATDDLNPFLGISARF